MALSYASIPQRIVGPIFIDFPSKGVEAIRVPLATFETPLWASVDRGAKATAHGGIQVTLTRQVMTRSVIVSGPSGRILVGITQRLLEHKPYLEEVVRETSNYCQLQDWTTEIVGNLLFMRFAFSTAEAAGHNMSTKAAQALLDTIIGLFPELSYSSISGNICTDKKPQAINGILGRGKSILAETVIPHNVCKEILKVTPAQIAKLNYHKNYVGSVLAGSIRSANAHFANMLLACYLATGQDAANIVEGSQGLTFVDNQGDGLYFAVSIPNLIVGCHGSGKTFEFVQQNLELLGCHMPLAIKDSGGELSTRLAQIIAAVVLCGELSLLAAQCNPGTLVRSHMLLERAKKY